MVKYLVMDVDGTLTDGKIYMGNDGEVLKAFSIKDGYVFNYILKPLGIVPIVITARESKIVQNRCSELGIDKVYQGKLDKFETLKNIIGENNLSQCAYIGDDIIDLKCMIPIKESGGIVGCPSDSVQEVKVVADYVCINKAGEGALREFVEWFSKKKMDYKNIEDRVQYAISYIKKLDTNSLVSGKYIVNEDFYYSVQEYQTKEFKDCVLESHKKYIDVQFIVKGREKFALEDISRLKLKTEYKESEDVMFWQVPSRMCNVTLHEGDYIVVYPENAHMGAIKESGLENVIKIVGKVKVQ